MKHVAGLAALVVLAGCATSYHPNSISGGFSETQLDRNVFRVSSRGNGYTDFERTTDFTLLRSAELTLENGYRYFAIVDSVERTKTVAAPAPATTNATVTTSGNTAYGTATTYGGGMYVKGK